MKTGRPSDYTTAKADFICSELATGKSLRTICKGEDMPATGTVYRWLIENKAFQDQYTHAREEQADTIFDEMLDIADDGVNDYQETAEGKKLNSEAIQRSRLRIDARKWVLGKLRPKKYGDKSSVEISGEIKGAPMIGFADTTKKDED